MGTDDAIPDDTIPDERRRHPRAELDLHVSLRFPSVQEFLSVYAGDISESGMFIRGWEEGVDGKPRLVGELLTLRFDAGEERIVQGTARIVRIVQGKESGIGSESVPFRINRKEYQMHVPRVEAALQLLQCLISLAEPGVQERHRVGRNIPLARDGFQCIQHLPGFVRAPQFCQQVPPERYHLAVAAGEPPGVLQCIQRQIAVAQLLVGLPELKVSNQKLGIEDNGLPRELDRRRIVAGIERDLGRERMMRRKRELWWPNLASECFGHLHRKF